MLELVNLIIGEKVLQAKIEYVDELEKMSIVWSLEASM